MPSLDVYNTKAKKISTTKVSNQIFAAKINPPLMTQAVRVYLSNQRQAPAKTKSRGEVLLLKRRFGVKKAPAEPVMVVAMPRFSLAAAKLMVQLASKTTNLNLLRK